MSGDPSADILILSDFYEYPLFQPNGLHNILVDCIQYDVRGWDDNNIIL